MRLSLILVGLFIANSISYAQKEGIDSLKKALLVAKPDTNKIILLNTLAYKLHRADPDEGIDLATQSIELAKELFFDKGLAHAYNSLGACYWNKTELDSALKYYEKSYSINQILGSSRGTTGALSNIAIIYENRGEYVNAVNTYSKALDEMRKEGFASYEAITSNNLGLVFMKIGSYAEALKYFNKAIELGEPLGMTNLTGPTWINIGNVHSSSGAPDLEVKAKTKAFEIGKKVNDKYIMALALNNLGNVFKKRKEFEKALNFFQQALAINEDVGRKSGIALNLSNIGATYRDMSMYEESIVSLQKGLAIANEVGHTKRIARTNYQLGETYKTMLECSTALPFFLAGYEIATKSRYQEEIKDLSKALYECYYQSGDYKTSVTYLSAYTAAKDSILNEENIKELAKVQAQYEFDKQLRAKNSEIQLLESREEVANLKITMLIIGVILILIVSFLVSRIVINKKERRKREVEAISKFRESMTGMIAHDLKSPLSIIMNSNEHVTTKQMAGQMLQLINNMLDVHRFEQTDVVLNKEEVPFSAILEEARTHVDFLLSEKELTLGVHLEQDYIVVVDRAIMVRVIVNLLTNAIKYSPFNESIPVVVSSKQGAIQVAITNKGNVIPADQQNMIFESFGQLDPKSSGGIGSTGLGLTFVKLAVQAHGSGIHVHSTAVKGTTFSFDLPLVAKQEIMAKMPSGKFEFSHNLKEKLSGKLAALRKLSIHQVGDIEKELKDLKNTVKETDEWVERLLNSVYAGNEERYNALLDELNRLQQNKKVSE
ncbi:MAG: tetratricopeptide repeat-containing sensor histidine kinase [Ekhidna sp.]